MLVVGLLLGTANSGPSPAPSSAGGAVLAPVSVAAPPATDATTVSTCAQVISALPLTLAGAPLRRTVSDPASGLIQAWGDPPIVLRCGVQRPANLVPGSSVDLIEVDHSVLFDPVREGDRTVFTVVDRSVYLDVSVPTSYPQPPLGPIATAVAQALPNPVCTADPNTPDPAKLCTRRK